MAEHRPVMLDEVLAGLALGPSGICVDATFGRGGHSEQILDQLDESGQLHAVDHDPQACQAAWSRFGTRKNFRIHQRNFSELFALMEELDLLGRVNGLLLDLGVSSPQLDEASRGFSFSKDGPLDMRMNPEEGESAAQWLARAEESEIARVLWEYGEERASRRIASNIVESRAQEPIESTSQLANLIAASMRGPRQKIHPATRSFQAIRIHVNRELDSLDAVLNASQSVLAPGGRLAVISFHSLEDRRVKRFLKHAAPTQASEPDPIAALYAVPSPPRAFREVARQFPSRSECETNPRARSAVLRIAEKL